MGARGDSASPRRARGTDTRPRRRLVAWGAGLAFLGLVALFSSPTQGAFTAQTSNGGTTLSSAQLDPWVPTSVTTTRTAPTTCQVTWTPAAGLRAGATYDITDGVTTLATGVSGTSTSVTVPTTQLTPQVRIRHGTWTSTATTTATTPCPGVPDPPVVTATAEDTQATATWTQPDDQGTAITTYTATTTPASQTCTITVPATRTCTFTGLTNGVTYTISVTATNTNGTSTPGTITTIPYPAAVMSASALKLWVDAASPTALFTDSSCSTPAAPGDRVACWNDQSPAGNDLTETTVPNQPTATTSSDRLLPVFDGGDDLLHNAATGLPTGTAASTAFVVAASSETTPATSPSTSALFWGSGITGGRRYITYAAGTGAISVDAGSTPTLTDGTWTTNTTHIVDTQFASGTYDLIRDGRPAISQTYPYSTTGAGYVRVGPNWKGPIKEVIVLNTTPTPTQRRHIDAYLARKWATPLTPDAPTGLTATPGNTQTSVSWTPPTWDGGAAITSYTTTASPGGATCTTATTTCTLTGLTNGTTYTLTVTATNTTGTGPGASVSATPMAHLLASAGLDDAGQLGLGLNTPLSPQQIGTATTWSSLAVGKTSTCGLRSDHSLWCWGTNDSGQLGQGDYATHAVPVQIGSATTWNAVTVGNTHACATRTDNTLWCWGSNSTGQLGIGSTTMQNAPTQVTGTVWATVDAGDSFTCATRTDGTLYCWGLNSSGQLGNGNTTQQTSPALVSGGATTWSSVSAGGTHTCATRTTHTVWCWGYNSFGQLGNGTSAYTAQTTPLQVGAATTWANVSAGGVFTCATQTTGTLWCWGYGGDGATGQGNTTSPTSPSQVTGAVTTWNSITTGDDHACATRTDSTAWCWGYNSSGQLGDATTTRRTSPTQLSSTWTTLAAGYDASCGLRATGALWCWGSNDYGELGLDPETRARQIGATSTWTTLGGGADHGCGITGGTLWCWGNNATGDLGDGSTINRPSPTQIGAATTWTGVAHGSNHGCGVRSDHTLYCWGDNGFGQQGSGDYTDHPAPTAVTGTTWASVSAGTEITCAIRADASLWCWGHAYIGQGDLNNQLSPVQVSPGASWANVSVGGNVTCAVRTDGTLWCWGVNTSGQVGIGNTSSPQNSPVQVSVGVTTWSRVAAGGNSACATRTDGTLWCWGLNSHGQLGDGTTTQRTSPVQVSGGVTTWNTVSVGSSHACATRTDDTTWCWGSNGFGQLGLGDLTNRTTPTQVPGILSQGVLAAANWTLFHAVALAPDRPTTVTPTPGNSSATVSWAAPALVGSAAITSYTATASPGGGTCTTASTGCTITGLTSGTSYTVTVTATNSVGTGPASAASASFTPTTVPGAPTGVTATASTTTSGQASVAWTAPASNGGSAITSYTATATASGQTTRTCTAASSPCTLTGLVDGITYSVTVTATNAMGTGAASSSATVVPYPATIMSGANFTLWLDGADPATQYADSTCTGAAATTTVGCWSDKSGNTNHATQPTAGNRPGLTTIAGRSVVNLNGSSSYLSLTVGKLPTARTTSTLFVLAATTDATYAAGDVVWWGTDGTGTKRTLFKGGTTVTYDNGGGGVTQPGINWIAGTLTEVAVEAATAANRSAANGADYGSATSYDFVTTTTAAEIGRASWGGGYWQGPVPEIIVFSRTLTTGERRQIDEYLGRKWATTLTPAAPGTPVATGGNTQATVSWTAPSWNGGSAITGYTVRSSPGSKTCTTVGATSCTVTGLTNGTSYTFTVTATNAVGIGTVSAGSNAVTPY
ncbi:MAG: fibronectin type III domain-containing protein [Kineosporiaceae bacterium]|nr:fibronectin type III domain-containing protein [Kineosporiaceae bacterium]